jgi:hypothetical protein
MVISNFQVHHVLRAYSQQLAERSRISKSRGNPGSPQKDQVTLSSESKARIMIDKVAQEFVSQLAARPERNEMAQQILKRLSQEYGQPLDVETDHGEVVFFKVVNEAGEGVPERLSPAVNEHLRTRLYDITQSFVYEQIR